MIEFNNLTKQFWTPSGYKIVADDISCKFPSRRSVALLGRNGAGKSTLMEMIGGSVKPTSGTIEVTGSVSWPVGFAGSFHKDLTGSQNTRFIARTYGVDTDELTAFVRHFSELKSYFHMPVRNYSAGMRSRLAFGISIGIPFDTYLVDEVTSVGDASFKFKSHAIFRERLKHSGAVVVSHSTRQIRQMCNAGAVLENGKLTYFDDVEDAIAQHQQNMESEIL